MIVAGPVDPQTHVIGYQIADVVTGLEAVEGFLYYRRELAGQVEILVLQRSPAPPEEFISAGVYIPASGHTGRATAIAVVKGRSLGGQAIQVGRRNHPGGLIGAAHLI